MKIVIGSDHGGFELKEKLKKWIVDKFSVEVIDVGTHSPESVDYPDFAIQVALKVANGEAEFGIMIDGVGVASAMVANKIPTIRAACCNEIFSAYNARAHNNANVLTMGSRVIGEEVAKRVVETFLTTEFEGGRHTRRVDKITAIENRVLFQAQIVAKEASSASAYSVNNLLPNTTSKIFSSRSDPYGINSLPEECTSPFCNTPSSLKEPTSLEAKIENVKRQLVNNTNSQLNSSMQPLKFVSEETVKHWKGDQIPITKKTIITPLARDIAKDLGKEFVIV